MISLYDLLLSGERDETPDEEPPDEDDYQAQIYAAARAERIPRLFVGVALTDDGGALAEQVRAAVHRLPGFRWEVEWLETEHAVRLASGMHVMLCPADAPTRCPRALRLLRLECGESGVPIVFVATERAAGSRLDSLPRRLALHLAYLFYPLREPAAPAQRTFGFEELTGRDLVSLPPIGPTVTLTRLDGGARLEAIEQDGTVRALAISYANGTLHVDSTLPLSSLRTDFQRWFERPRATADSDAFSDFADSIAGRGLPARALLQPLVRRARLWLARALPRSARSVARAFHPSTRLDVVRRVAADPSGRVAQLAKVCPGVFVLAVGLGARDALDEACLRTIRGEPLADALAPVLARWAAGRKGAVDVARHSRFVRRAPAALDPRLSLYPFPIGLALDDVPSEPAARAAWFTAAGAFAGRTDCHAHAPDSPLAAFVSAQGASLGVADPRHLKDLLTRLELRGQALGRWPARRTTMDAAKRAAGRFYEGISTRRVPSRRLFSPTNSDLRVRMLHSAVELAAEGERMRHCLANYEDYLYEGKLMLFSGTYENTRFTASATILSDGTLLLDEMSCSLGRLPPRAARKAMEAWLREQLIDVGYDPVQR